MAIRFTQTVDLGLQKITALGSPSAGTDAVNKDYVDNIVQGLDWRPSVRAATTGPIDLAAVGAAGVDAGVTLNTGDRILVKNQADPTENGIYIFGGNGAAATPATDALTAGAAVSVEEGTANQNKTYVLTADGQTWTVMAGGTSGSTYVAGNGLALDVGTSFRVVASPGGGLSVDGTGVRVDPNYVVRKIAFDVGDGAANAFNLAHNLATRDVSVQVYATATPWDTVFCEVQRPDVNTVTVVFATAPANGAYRVVVQG